MADKTKKIGHAAGQWHVRDENGGVFGPVDFPALKSWVEDGRVSPASEVSSGGGSWVLAVQVRELEMDCVAEIEPGSFYGPIHRKAMRGLMATGAISAEAAVYCKGSAVQAAEHDQSGGGHQTEELEGLRRQLAGVERQKSSAEAALQRALREMADLSAVHQSEKEAGRELRAAAAGLRQEVEALRAEGSAYQAQIAALQLQRAEGETQVSALQGRCAEQQVLVSGLQRESGELQALVSGLRRESGELQALVSGLRRESAEQSALITTLRGELEAARVQLAESQRAADKTVLKYQGEMLALNEVNSGLRSQVDLYIKESADFAAEIEALRSHSREQSQLLEERDRSYRAEFREKESAALLKMETLAREHEAALNRLKHQSAKEHARHVEEVETRNRQIAGLLVRLEELELANRELKEEFVRCEHLQSRGGEGEAARRKLVVMKKLLAEAAALLDGEESVSEEVPDALPSAAAAERESVELLDYEEVLAEDFAARKAPSGTSAEPVKAPSSGAEPARKRGTAQPKAEKKWPFGGSRKNLGHESLAELEAQAQMELQRLASKQEISAIFDRKK